MFKLGIITDEVYQDFEEALKFAKEYGLECVELRSAWEKNPFQYSEEDFSKIADLLKKYKMPLVCISSPMFKCSYFDEEAKKEHIEGLKRLIAQSDKLGFKMIRCFDFINEDGLTLDLIKKAFKEPIALCEKAGITLVLESEPSANSSDCKRTAETVKYINSPTVKALYEPGNNIYSDTDEIPYPDGYNAVKDVFCHVHIKDAIKENGITTGVRIGDGAVDYKGMIKEFITSEYNGAVIFEPHYKPGLVMSEELLRNPQGSQISAMGDIASKECILSLNEIINNIKKEIEL